MFNGFTSQDGNVGQLRISRDVIVTIARQAASEVPGVHTLAKIPVDVKTCIQHKGIPAEIAVDLSDNTAVIDLALVLEGGFKLTNVVEQVQAGVKEAVQTMTGVAVSKVNVVVEGIYFPPTAEKDAE